MPKIKYTGMVGKVSKASGCSKCGNSKRAIKTQKIMRKTYLLPSGMAKEFVYGKVYDVTEADFNYLMEQSYEESGQTIHSFEEVI